MVVTSVLYSGDFRVCTGVVSISIHPWLQCYNNRGFSVYTAVASTFVWSWFQYPSAVASVSVRLWFQCCTVISMSIQPWFQRPNGRDVSTYTTVALVFVQPMLQCLYGSGFNIRTAMASSYVHLWFQCLCTAVASMSAMSV